MLSSLFGRSRRRQAVAAAYHRIVEQARDTAFFTRWGVPDTLDGRFEVLALHAFLVLNRLKAAHAETADFAQELFDTMFADLDRALREMGATDLGVGRHVKEMARGFYGRALAYERALGGDDTALSEALQRNLLAGVPDAAMAEFAARYTRRQAKALAAKPTSTLLAGDIPFLPVTEDTP